MVRSIFEHCPVVWRPSSDTTINKLEASRNVQLSGLIRTIAKATVLMNYFTMPIELLQATENLTSPISI